MTNNIALELLILLCLTLANGFFAASEIAIVSARKSRLEQQAQAGQRGAAAALALAENPSRFLSTVQVGITLISTCAAVFGGAGLSGALEGMLAGIPILAPYARSLALALVVLLVSYLSLIVGELVPKRLALQSAEAVSSAVAPFMGLVSRAASPAVGFLTLSTELVLRVLGRHNVAETPITEDDIIAMVREGASEGTVEATEQELITNVFSFADRTVRSLMTPRTQIAAVAADTPFAAALEAIAAAGYSRVPVYRDSLDQIVGMLYVKDLLQAWGRPDPPDLAELLRPARFVLESQRAIVVFQQLKQERGGMAMVIDEYGQVAGLITLEDILEEVVGEIDDEYDEAGQSIVRRDDGSYLVDGLMPYVDVREQLGLPESADLAPGQSFETLAGLVLALLGRIPQAGDHVIWNGYRFEVVDMDGRRIDKLLIVLPPEPEGAQSERALATGAIPPPMPDQS
ncbi:MAG TPA: hemolysin family protein [Kouleothrix sp.]|uniref:hemolysin family protein n=1 Tax=Kouleothrix sp. TaxID=2779161 RepID=UPI002BFF9644|nr:hemolysin family protein [Kouleothrix sp.]HRC74546.1 hemolysin family protein [Kouleothrix sp.]